MLDEFVVSAEELVVVSVGSGSESESSHPLSESDDKIASTELRDRIHLAGVRCSLEKAMTAM